MIGRAARLMIVAALAACEPSGSPSGPSDASASPNASILPAPLATEPPELFDGGDDGGQSAVIEPRSTSDGGAPPPESMRPSTPIPAESVPYTRDASGVSLDAVFRWRDVPPPPRAPEVSIDGLREANKLTALALKIDLTDIGRMRLVFTGHAFPLPAHTEIRARTDHYGNIVLWPTAGEYRVIPPGALRPVLGERRVDVTPLSAGTVRAQGEGRRLGYVVRKLELTSTVATVKMEIGKVGEAGDGGLLLCRAIVELGGVDPRTPICQPGEVPLFASYVWQEGGGIVFEVTGLQKRTDLPASGMLVPAPGVRHVPTGLPTVPQGIFLAREELVAFRSAPLQLPPTRDPAVPGEGFVAVNNADRLMYLLLDGVPVVAVPPHGERYVIGPPRGRYLAQWRTFLGEKVLPPQPIEMPARIVFGNVADAGAPDGG
ncbi:Hypothetical protein A7982_09033 [Minicystis rosea]|nr:Hypothetical protein A7982_09033 [Minicystis rosea]